MSYLGRAPASRLPVICSPYRHFGTHSCHVIDGRGYIPYYCLPIFVSGFAAQDSLYLSKPADAVCFQNLLWFWNLYIPKIYYILKSNDFHSYILFKGIFFYLFEIELLLFLSSTPCSCTEEFSQFHFVFVLASDNLSFISFDHIFFPSAFQTGESESLVSLCNIAVLFLAHQLISTIAISSLTCRDQSNTPFGLWTDTCWFIWHKNYTFVLVPIFFKYHFGCHCIQI